MASRAFLADRIVEVDAERSVIRLTPVRWPVVVVAPALMATPIALCRVQLGGSYELQKVGWVLALGYSVIAVVMTVMFLSPWNRRVEVDLAKRRLVIAKPYGGGIDVDEPLDNLDVKYSEIETRSRGTVVYTGKLTATSGERSFTIAHLSGKGATTSTSNWDNVDIARQLAGVVRAAKAGYDPELTALQAAVGKKGPGTVLRSLGILFLVAGVGLAYAYAAASGNG